MAIRNLIAVTLIVVVTFMAGSAFAGELTIDDQARIAQAACEVENGSAITWRNAETGTMFFCTAVASAEREDTVDGQIRQTRLMEVSTMTTEGITEPVRYNVVINIGGFGENSVDVVRAN